MNGVIVFTTLVALTQARADGDAAQCYCDWAIRCADAVEQNIPEISESSEASARLFVEQDYGIVAIGDPGLVAEATGRAGGLMSLQRHAPREVVLVFPREDTLTKDVHDAVDLKNKGHHIVFFGRPEFLDAARAGGLKADAWIDTHAADHGGLIRTPDGQWTLPTDQVAAMIVLWTWTGEFVGACTRLGKLPTMYQSYSVPGALERARRLGALKFHTEIPRPIEKGNLGKQYVAAVRAGLQAIRKDEMGNIQRAADRAVTALATQHACHCIVTGHALPSHIRVPHAPSIFQQIGEQPDEIKGNAKVGAGDIVLLVGYDATFGPIEALRELGSIPVWSFATYKNMVPRPEKVRDVTPGEILVDQGWDYGDAVASVPGYDIRILPTSAILAETVVWMVTAEVMGLQCSPSP